MSKARQCELRRLKYAATINDEALTEETDPDFELRYVDIGNVDSSGQIHEIATYRFQTAPSRARRIVRDGDVIISTVRTYLQAIAAIEKPPDNLIVSTGFAVVRPRKGKLDASFCKYAVRESRFLHEVVTRSVGVSYPAINASDLGDISIPLPPVAEQRVIAAYLDRETARLDALVAAKERWLELLAEKRRVLITRAVQGVHPSGCSGAANRLKPGHQTPPLRDTGLPWLGQIPVHWQTKRLKFACDGIQTGGTPSLDYMDNADEKTVNWFTPVDFNESLELRDSSRKISTESVAADEAPLFPARTAYVVCIGATLGKVGYCGEPASVNRQVNALRPCPETDSLFLAFMLSTLGELMQALANSATLPILNQQRMGEISVAVPPLAEQRAIVAYIGSATAKLDGLHAAAERTIALLKERRAALITAAVTGQIEPEAMSA